MRPLMQHAEIDNGRHSFHAMSGASCDSVGQHGSQEDMVTHNARAQQAHLGADDSAGNAIDGRRGRGKAVGSCVDVGAKPSQCAPRRHILPRLQCMTHPQSCESTFNIYSRLRVFFCCTVVLKELMRAALDTLGHFGASNISVLGLQMVVCTQQQHTATSQKALQAWF